MALSAILRGIKQLLSPPREGANILQSLGEVLDTFQSFTRELELKDALESAVSRLKIPQYPESFGDGVAVYCKFKEQGIAMLTLLDETLRQAHTEDQKQQPSQPNPPQALLGSAEEKSVHTLLQFLVALGVFPFLLSGADTVLRLQLGEMAPLISRSSAGDPTKYCYLYHHCRPLVRLFTAPVIGPSVVSRHLSTVLVGLLQVSYSPQTSHHREQQQNKSPHSSSAGVKPLVLSEAEVKQCQTEMKDLLDILHQPLVVRELLRLQGATQRGSGGGGEGVRWVQRACGGLLSERLMKEGGLRAVLVGVFDAMSGDEGVGSGCRDDWKKVQAVAHIVSRCPSQASSPSHYYSIIGPQLLEMLALSGGAAVKIVATTISLMMGQQPALTRTHIIHPLTRPLRLTATGNFTDSDSPSDLGKAVEMSIGGLHRLCSCVVEPSSPLMVEFQPFLPVIFRVWQTNLTTENQSKTFRSEVASVLVGIFNSLDEGDKISFLRCLAGMSPATQCAVQWVSVAPEVHLEFSERGVCVGRVSGEVEEVWSVERMERDGKAILELLGKLFKSSHLIGQFFLECLTRVAAILCRDVDHLPTVPRVKQEMKTLSSLQGQLNQSASSVLLDIERDTHQLSQAESYHRSLALYLTAVLSEERTSDVIEQADQETLLQVLAVVIECHAHLVTRKKKTLSDSPVDLLLVRPDLQSVLGGSITLSVALGYLSAILTAANKIEKEYRAVLSGMVGPLEVIAGGYPDPELAELAGDVRVCIATLGAVWSSEMRERGRRGGVRGDKGEGEIFGGGKEEGVCPGELSEGGRVRLVEEIPGSDAVLYPHSPENDESGDEEMSSKFKMAISEARDPQIPVRGHGLSSLARLIETGDKETRTHSTELLRVFKDALRHSDSYVYLPAIGGLVKLASRELVKVLSVLCEGYALFSRSPSTESRKSSSSRVDKETGKMSKNRQSSTEKHSRVDKKLSEKKQSSAEKREGENLEEVSLEQRLKLGEALVRVCRECGEMLPHYSEGPLAAVLSNARDPHPLVRASALSNLAQICQLLGHSFARHHHEVLGCVTDLLLSDPAPQVQQSALLVLTLLLKGLSHRSVEVLGGSLQEVYRLLKRVEGERERDEVTREHARAALAELEQIMKEWTFPKPSLTYFEP